MRAVASCNDLIRLSFLQALLRDAGIETALADGHASAVQGSLSILPRRLMVADDRHEEAMAILREAGELDLE